MKLFNEKNFEKHFTNNAVRIKTDLTFKKRVRSIIALLLVVLTVFSMARIGWIIGVKGDEYRSLAQRNQLHDTEIKAIRGTIYDCNMSPIVTSSSAWILRGAPLYIYKEFYNKDNDDDVNEKNEIEFDKYIKYLSKHIAEILEMKSGEVYEKLSQKDKGDVRIRGKIDAIKRLKLDEFFAEAYRFKYGNEKAERRLYATGLFSYETDNIRLYPDNNFASTLIGVTNAAGNGITGVERYYDEELSGSDGRMLTAQNSMGKALDSSFEKLFDAKPGNGIVLTIDKKIQYTLENALSQALDSTKAKGVYGIVMDVKTGKILAMSDKPDFDLNDPYTLLDETKIAELEEYKNSKDFSKEGYDKMLSSALYDQWDSFCVTSTYEPGSTFKIFTAAAALEEGIVTLDTGYTCNGYYRFVDDTVIHCANRTGHGYQSLTRGLMNSCNPFFIDIGQKMGVDTFYKYFQAFGFTERTRIDLTGEAKPVYHKKEDMHSVELASTSFGQSFRVSPIQMITAGCAIANGGNLMTPYVVDSIVDSQGNIIKKNEPTVKRRVISEGTAATVRQMMEAVVEGGTGKNAYIEGYRVAGKTATSEKLDYEGGAEGVLKYIASFLCFAPANDPQVAILVGVDEPPGEYRGGGVLAAPIAKEIMADTLKYLNVEPQYTADELKNISKTAPPLMGESVANARILASNEGLTLRVVGNGDSVVSQMPVSGQMIPENGVVVVYTDKKAAAEIVKMPDFNGMSSSLVNQTATACGINVTFSGPAGSAGAKAYRQSIERGTKVQAGTSVTVYFQSTTNMDDDR